MVTLLRVLSILHISICMPLRWLAGNCGNLSEYGFGVADMPVALDLLDEAMGKVAVDGDLLLDEDFMMGIFSPLVNKVTPFEQYVTYMFEEKRSFLVGSRADDDKMFPFEFVKNELFYSTRKDIVQTQPFYCSALCRIRTRVPSSIQMQEKGNSKILDSHQWREEHGKSYSGRKGSR